MQLERTFSGLEARLRSRGASRFFSAAFLIVWLSFWAVGEAFVLWFLGVGAWALITGRPPEAGRAPLELAPSLTVGLFLLAWLAMWTVGGIAALYELMRLLWARDRLVAHPTGLEITRRTGLFSRTRRLPREQLRGLYRLHAGSVVMAETNDGSVELTRLGRPAEQDELVRAFRAELALPDRAAFAVALPSEWCETAAPEGGSLLLKNPTTRRKQAIVAWMITLPVCAVAAIVTRAAFDRSTLSALAVMVGLVALAATWGSLRLSTTRTEWKLEPGKLTLQRRTGSRVRVLFEGQAVALSSSRDSDGDTWYAAEAVATTGPNPTPRDHRRARRTLLNHMHDSTDPRRMAEWVAARCRVPFSDTTTSAATAADLAAVVRQLEATGRFGRWTARFLTRAAKK